MRKKEKKEGGEREGKKERELEGRAHFKRLPIFAMYDTTKIDMWVTWEEEEEREGRNKKE